MCLAVPVQVLSIEGTRAKVALSGNVHDADLSLVEEAGVGDWVLMHAGFAIERLTAEDAAETLRLIGQIEGIGGDIT